MATIKRHSLVVFFILAYAFSWAVWGTHIAQAHGLINFHIPDTLAYWGLCLATFLTAALTGGLTAVKDLIFRMLRWRVNSRWYAVALLLTILIVAVALAIYAVLGGSLTIGQMLPLQAVPLTFLIQFGLMLATEENAWRGFALPRLQHGRTSLSASLILGLLWTVWHLPLFFIADSFQSRIPFIGFALITLATTIIITWLYNHTRGSVLLTALFHASTNTVLSYSGVLTGDLRSFWLYALLVWLVVVVIIVVEGATHLARKSDTSAAPSSCHDPHASHNCRNPDQSQQ